MNEDVLDIKYVDRNSKTVFFTDGSSVTHKEFMERFLLFLNGRIAGATLYPADMERFMRRTSGKNLSLLMKGKKAEGYMEGVMDRLLTPRQTIAIGVIFGGVIMAIVAIVVLRNMGILNF